MMQDRLILTLIFFDVIVVLLPNALVIGNTAEDIAALQILTYLVCPKVKRQYKPCLHSR
jgi:hypothetical protein